MNTTTNNIETEFAALEEERTRLQRRLERADAAAEKARAVLRAAASEDARSLEDKDREERAAKLRRRRELEQQKQVAEQDYYAAREAANAALAEPVRAMCEAEERWVALLKELYGVGTYIPSIDHIPPRELQPFGEAVDAAYRLLCQVKEREEEKRRQRLIREQEEKRLHALRAARQAAEVGQ